MASKKEHMLRESAPAYRMGAEVNAPSLADALWTIVRALPESDRAELISLMLDNPEWREDIGDAILIIESRDQPTRPYEEFEEELRRDGLQ